MRVILNLNEVNENKDLNFEFEVLKDENLDKRILDLNNTLVKGRVYLDSTNDICLECNFTGVMQLSDSITLKSIPYKFDINIDENITEIEDNYPDCIDFSKNTLDLKQILWQNIVLEVPISYTKEKDANLKGNGWELVSEDRKENDIDPRLKKLEELLERRD